MSKLKSKPWEQRGWVCGNVLSAGNQGRVYLARKGEDPPDKFNYVIKLLLRNNFPRARTLFFAEASMMQMLSHPGIPAVIDTNAAEFRADEELYLVMPYINGQDLVSHAKQGVSFSDSISVVIEVLNILDYCHSLDRLHRDVKPCHVLIVEGDFKRPHLIDFGIGFAADDLAETRTGEGKGNRFLVGPEHTPSGTTDNRSPATDVCQCLGLLYYLLTGGTEPGVLLDSDKRKPHQREPILYTDEVPEWKHVALRATFDRGFEWHPLNRWKSARDLIDRLTPIASQEDPKVLQIQMMAESAITDGLVEMRLNNDRTASELKSKAEKLIRLVVSELRSVWNGKIDIQLSEKGSFGEGIISFRPAYMQYSPIAVLPECKREPTQLRIQLRRFNGDPEVFGSNNEIDLCIIPYDSPEAIDNLQLVIAECLVCIAREVVKNNEIS